MPPLSQKLRKFLIKEKFKVAHYDEWFSASLDLITRPTLTFIFYQNSLIGKVEHFGMKRIFIDATEITSLDDFVFTLFRNRYLQNNFSAFVDEIKKLVKE